MNYSPELHSNRRQFLRGLGAALTLPALGAWRPQGLAAEATVPKGLRVYTCGHSFHVFVPALVEEMAKAAAISDHVTVGRSSIGGSRVIQHWDLADDKFQAKAILGEGKADVLTLSPIWLPDEGIENFAKLALEHNPNVLVTVQLYWLPNDTYHPVYPLETKLKIDHNATDVAELKKQQDKYDHDVDEYCRAINKKLGKDVIVTVPVGQATVTLREKIVAGKAPGLEAQWDLFRDNWGHPQAALRVLDGYCHYAVMYRRSPAGITIPRDLATAPKGTPEEKKALNTLLQELAWEAVTRHPMSGVKA